MQTTNNPMQVVESTMRDEDCAIPIASVLDLKIGVKVGGVDASGEQHHRKYAEPQNLARLFVNPIGLELN